MDALRKDGKASMPEQVKRPNAWKKKMMTCNVVTERNKAISAVYTYRTPGLSGG